jgi:small subunit ribosomal protein S3
VGRKVHPNGFRLGVYRGWEANWFATDKDYVKLLHEDMEMRRLIMGRLRNAGIARIETERSSNAQLTVTIHTAKPGIVIGKGGASVDQLREDLEKRFQNRVRISINEIKQPELNAQLVAENIASQIERRISYRRAMKQSILRTMRAGAKGVRIAAGGRLRGSEMARREWDREGRVPLHTLRADIDFGRATARTTFGMIGVKCWIYKGLVPGRKRGGELEIEGIPQPVDGGTPAPAAAAAATAAAATAAPAAAAPPAPAPAPTAPVVAEAPAVAEAAAPAVEAPPAPEAAAPAATPVAPAPVEAPATPAAAATVEAPPAPEAAAPAATTEPAAAEPAPKAPRKRTTKAKTEPATKDDADAPA